MTYSVVWTFAARSQLAELWLGSGERQNITAAANQIDMLLKSDPAGQAAHLHEGLWTLSVAPLTIIFELREADRMVEVARVRLYCEQ